MSHTSSRVARLVSAAAALTAIGVALAACAPEPPSAAETPPASSSSPSASSSPTDTVPTATPTVSPAALPTDCTALYSAGMLATLEAQVPPLNDPGVTMYSTEQAPLLELLETVPTLRCSWGAPSEVGMSTNVSAVDGAQADAVLAALAAAGFGCETADATTICRIEQRGVSLDDVEYARGETHAVRGGLWVATSWINVDPEGYTDDILAALAG